MESPIIVSTIFDVHRSLAANNFLSPILFRHSGLFRTFRFYLLRCYVFIFVTELHPFVSFFSLFFIPCLLLLLI